MQKLILSFLVLAAVAGVVPVSGCKKDNAAAVRQQITGKWNFERIDYINFIGGIYDTTFEIYYPGSYMQFNADKTFSAVQDLEYEGTWDYADDRLTLTLSDSVVRLFDVQKLSGNQLVLFNRETDSALNYIESTWQLKR